MRYNTKEEPIDDDDICYKEHNTYFEAYYICSTCSYNFSIISTIKPKGECPSCPKCKDDPIVKGVNKTKGRVSTKKQLEDNNNDMLISGKTPYISGKNKLYKAHENTMKMVMEDYGFTDINDRPNEGENCVPKLPSHLEKKVNDGFGASFGSIPDIGNNVRAANIASVGMQSINSGKFRDQTDVVALQQKYGAKPKFNFINEHS